MEYKPETLSMLPAATRPLFRPRNRYEIATIFPLVVFCSFDCDSLWDKLTPCQYFSWFFHCGSFRNSFRSIFEQRKIAIWFLVNDGSLFFIIPEPRGIKFNDSKACYPSPMTGPLLDPSVQIWTMSLSVSLSVSVSLSFLDDKGHTCLSLNMHLYPTNLCL